MARIVQPSNDDDRVALQPAKVTTSRLARRSPLNASTTTSTDVTLPGERALHPMPEGRTRAAISATSAGSNSGTEDMSLTESQAALQSTALVSERMAATLAPPRKPAVGTRSLQRPGFSNTTTEGQKNSSPTRPRPPISSMSRSVVRPTPPVTTSLPREAVAAKTTKTTASTPLRFVRQPTAARTLRTPNTALAPRPVNRPVPATTTPSHTSRSSGNITTPSTKSLSSFTMPRPLRSAANTSSPTKPPLPKPSFTTYQRSFSPSKPLPTTPASSSSFSSISKLNPTHIRSQTHLLHLSLLHAAAAPTLAAYTLSAHANLLAIHKSLQTLYTQVLVMERQARQAENVLTLHRWAGGNVNSVGRRLNVLCAVLRDVMALTAPGGRMVPARRRGRHVEHGNEEGHGEDDENAGEDREPVGEEGEEEEAEELVEEQQGQYAILIADFTAWTTWVQAIWRARDKDLDDDGCDTTASPDMATTPSPAGSAPLLNTPDSSTITPIDPLGDAPKASLRSLTHTINALLLRLNDLPAFPASHPPTLKSITPASPSNSPPAPPTPPTPIHLLALSLTLLIGMQEELQLMREIEFEIVVGEEAWTRQRLGRLAGEVESGFGTPIRR